MKINRHDTTFNFFGVYGNTAEWRVILARRTDTAASSGAMGTATLNAQPSVTAWLYKYTQYYKMCNVQHKLVN